jgi:ferredoxin
VPHILRINPDKCTGHGRCYSVAPDLLSDDEQGFVAERGTDVIVPENLLDQAYEAENACPELAITVDEA